MIKETPLPESHNSSFPIASQLEHTGSQDAHKRVPQASNDRVKSDKTRLNQRVKCTKMAKHSSSENEDVGPQSFLDPAKIEQMKVALLEIQHWTVSELKEALRKNQQSTNGTKLDLLSKVTDGKVFGKIPRCPACHSGYLKMDFSSGIYYCAGFHQGSTHYCCKSSFPFQHIRRDQWTD